MIAGRDCPSPARTRRSAALKAERSKPRSGRLERENGVTPWAIQASPPKVSQLAGLLQQSVIQDSRLAASGQPVDLASCLTKVLFVPQTLTVMELVESFKKRRQTLALVVNEFGEVQGIVTLHDVMESLVGDIATLDQPESEIDIIRREDGSWLVDGGVTIDRFKDVLGIQSSLPEEGSGFYQTIGGFSMTHLGRDPRVADKFNWDHFCFEIVDMDNNRVDKLIVTAIKREQ